MTIRLKLICHAATAAQRMAAFPDDEPIEPRGLRQLASLTPSPGDLDQCWTSPALRARQTAEGLCLVATVEPLLRECDYGCWAGLPFADVQAREPDAIAAWLHDPAASAHGGDTIVDLIARIAAWLDGPSLRPGLIVAVTHASVIRAAIVHALGADPRSFWRIDIAPLTAVMLSGHRGRWNLSGISSLARPGVA